MINQNNEVRTNLTDKYKQIRIKIGKRLKVFRNMNGFSQYQVAGFLGITHQQYQKYESGKNRMPIEKLPIILEKFHLKSYDDIFCLASYDDILNID